jgi:hypothetical protein
MFLLRKLHRRLLFAGPTALSLTCHAQNAMTPAQALDYRRVGDLHLSPDGAKLSYVMYSGIDAACRRATSDPYQRTRYEGLYSAASFARWQSPP